MATVTVRKWHTTGADSHQHLFECYSSRDTSLENRREGEDRSKPVCGECSHWHEILFPET